MKIFLLLFFLQNIISQSPPVCLEDFQKQAAINEIKARVDGIVYTAVFDTLLNITILNSNGRTVCHILGTNNIASLTFTDFNGDGYKDIVVNYFTNVPDVQDLLLYDKKNKNFKIVPHFDRYPAAIRLSHTGLYYSYHRSGCADLNWDSDLFRIINFKIVKVGNIKSNGCGGEDSGPAGILVYKYVGKHQQLEKTFSISALNEYKDWKWGFIANYWKHNYQKFI